jgi:hypothetical protein
MRFFITTIQQIFQKPETRAYEVSTGCQRGSLLLVAAKQLEINEHQNTAQKYIKYTKIA